MDLTSTTSEAVPGQPVINDFDRAELEGQVGALRRQLDEQVQRNQVLINDLRTMAGALRDEAISRDWCSQYGNFVDEWNAQMSMPWLEHCVVTRELVFQITVEIECRSVDDSNDAAAELTGYFGDNDISLDTNGASVNAVNSRLLRNDPA